MPYCDIHSKMGFYNILDSFRSGRVKKTDIIKPTKISVSDIFNIYSKKGNICVTTSQRFLSNPKYWRGIKRNYLEELIKISKISSDELRKNIQRLLTDKKYYLSKTVNYYNNFEYSIPHKSILEKYCDIKEKNKKLCYFTVSLDNIIKLI